MRQSFKEIEAEYKATEKKYRKASREHTKKVLLPKTRALIGKYFKYRNNYSCPEKPSDYWFLYTKVTSLDKEGFLRGVSFQIDRYGNLNLEPNTIVNQTFDGDLYEGNVEISEKEYIQAFNKVLELISEAQ